MTEKTIKELLEMEFFPTDDQGRQLVSTYFGDVTIFATDVPGAYPILGIGPRGYPESFDEYGIRRQDAQTVTGPEGVVFMSDTDQQANSLTPPDMQRIVQFVIVEADGTVDCSYDTREEAEHFLGFGEQIVELDGYGYVADITDASDDQAEDFPEWTADFAIEDDGQTYSGDEQPSPYIFQPHVGGQANNVPYNPGLYPRFPWTR